MAGSATRAASRKVGSISCKAKRVPAVRCGAPVGPPTASAWCSTVTSRAAGLPFGTGRVVIPRARLVRTGVFPSYAPAGPAAFAGSTTVTATAGAIDATVTVSVEPGSLVVQWAIGATASSEYTAAEWSANQATGIPDVTGCVDHPGAWASLLPVVDWLELTCAQPVRPSEIRIHEVWGVGSIVRVEVKDVSGTYHTVHTAKPHRSADLSAHSHDRGQGRDGDGLDRPCDRRPDRISRLE